MWIKTVYFLVVATLFSAPLSPFGKSVFFYLLLLLFLFRFSYLYFKRADYVERFFILIGWLYIISLWHFKEFAFWFKSFSGEYLIVFLWYVFLKYLYSNLSFPSSRLFFCKLLLFLIMVTGLVNVVWVLTEYSLFTYYPTIYKDYLKFLHRRTGMAWIDNFATGRWGHWNPYGSHLTATLILIFYFLLRLSRKKSWKIKFFLYGLLFFLATSVLLNIFFIGSRSTLYLALPVIIFISLVVYFKDFWKWKYLFLVFILIWGGSGYLVWKNLDKRVQYKIFTKYKMFMENIKKKKASDREVIFKKAILFLKDKSNYIWGVGPGKIREFFQKRRVYYLSLHNIFLQYWMELGIGGFIFLVWFLGLYFFFNLKSFYIYCRTEDNSGYGRIATFTFILVFAEIIKNCWDYLFFDSGYSFLFYTLIFINIYSWKAYQEQLRDFKANY